MRSKSASFVGLDFFARRGGCAAAGACGWTELHVSGNARHAQRPLQLQRHPHRGHSWDDQHAPQAAERVPWYVIILRASGAREQVMEEIYIDGDTLGLRANSTLLFLSVCSGKGGGNNPI